MTWRDHPFAGYDLETDGVDLEDARIVTATVGLQQPGGWQATSWLLKPARPISDEAAAIHGVTTERAEHEGIPRRAALSDIRAHLSAAWLAGASVCAFNARFDWTILDRELRREGLDPLPLGGVLLDPYVIIRQADFEAHEFAKGRRYTLGACCERFGITLNDAHTSGADAHAAARLAWKVCGSVPYALDLDERADTAHQYQADAYARDRASFARWLAKKGETPDDPDTSWPLRAPDAAKAA